jgi:Predicted nucleotide-binding protein containing TIR-like domain
MKPKVFIGSSSEGLEIAYALQSNLEDDGEITVWTQDVFRPSEFVLESLLKQLDTADVGIFVFSPDDTVVIRGGEHPAVRDNVILEVGLYVGRLGRDRCFIVLPRGSNPRLPSDLLGVTILNFDGARADGRLEAALGPASSKIRLALSLLAPTLSIPCELRVPVMERRGMLSTRQRELLEVIEAKSPISRAALGYRFSGVVGSELHYRLEQLRLLQFIISKSCNDTPETTVLTLHPLYEYARREEHGLGTILS